MCVWGTAAVHDKTRIASKNICDGDRMSRLSNIKSHLSRYMILTFILYGTPKYEIFSLRIDMNILSTSCSTKSILSTCPLCSREPETVKHFTLKCSRFADEREKFIGSIISHTPSFRMKDYVYQQKYILGLHCPPEAISYCCKYISTICSLRENDEIQIHRNCVSLCIYVFLLCMLYVYLFCFLVLRW